MVADKCFDEKKKKSPYEISFECILSHDSTVLEYILLRQGIQAKRGK